MSKTPEQTANLLAQARLFLAGQKRWFNQLAPFSGLGGSDAHGGILEEMAIGSHRTRRRTQPHSPASPTRSPS